MNTLDGRESSLTLRPTTLTDLSFVIEAERHPENASYIGQWNEARHAAAISSQDEAHFILEVESQLGGYLILTGLRDPHFAIHLQRIVVLDKGKGYGRQALRWVKAYAFEVLGFHRLWFDVIASNEKAKSLYLDEGFIVEGKMRDGWKIENRYEDLILLSMLQSEYMFQSDVP
ncbi:MAG: GNAT family N-acetyltransferase [Phormidesmis sp.]